MQHSFKFSNIMKWSFGLLALLLISATAQSQPVEAVLNNDLDCNIKVRVYGRIGTGCGPSDICFEDFVVSGSGGSVTVVVGDMPCGVDEFLGARVHALCAPSTNTSVEKSAGCFGFPQSSTFTLTGTCSTSCNASTVNVDLTSGSFDITVDVN